MKLVTFSISALLFLSISRVGVSSVLLGVEFNDPNTADPAAIVSIDPSTGGLEFYAPTGLDQLINFQFELDTANHRAFAFGYLSGQLAISTIDLQTRTATTAAVVAGYSLESYHGQLLGLKGGGSPSIVVLDPSSGVETTLVGSVGLDHNVNTQFVVDESSDTAYIMGLVGSEFMLSTVDLIYGTSTVVPLDLHSLAANDGQLLGVVAGPAAPLVYEIDPTTGERGFIGSSGVDRTLNFSFEVDRINNVAYRTGLGPNDEVIIGSIDLDSGVSTSIPAAVGAVGVYEIPEPATGILALLGGLGLVLCSRRTR